MGKLMYVGTDGSNFATKLLGYLQQADYYIADNQKMRDEVFRLRYDCYLREGAIEPNLSKTFEDQYDRMDNCWIFAVYLENKLVSSIRCHVISRKWNRGPSLDVFPDIVGPMIHDEALTLVDPTRFVVDVDAAKMYPELPFMTLRAACMTYDYHMADYCLASVRKEHAAFYRRVFKAELLSEPRPYPTLKTPICLLRTNVSRFRNELLRRYPIFESSLTERRMLFEQPARQLGDRFGTGFRAAV